MSGTIIIENLTGRHLQYRIDHQTVCVKVGKCFCGKGKRGTVTTTIHVPGGAGMRTGPLHPAITKIAAVQKDASGVKPKIRILGSEEAPKKAKAKADSTSPDKKGSSGRKGKN